MNAVLVQLLFDPLQGGSSGNIEHAANQGVTLINTGRTPEFVGVTILITPNFGAMGTIPDLGQLSKAASCLIQ
eukprot:5240704-Prorocentrum_lima.AAC.1